MVVTTHADRASPIWRKTEKSFLASTTMAIPFSPTPCPQVDTAKQLDQLGVVELYSFFTVGGGQ
jgi:hypothetical protein